MYFVCPDINGIQRCCINRSRFCIAYVPLHCFTLPIILVTQFLLHQDWDPSIHLWTQIQKIQNNQILNVEKRCFLSTHLMCRYFWSHVNKTEVHYVSESNITTNTKLTKTFIFKTHWFSAENTRNIQYNVPYISRVYVRKWHIC